MADGESVIVGSETDSGSIGNDAATSDPIRPSLKKTFHQLLKDFAQCLEAQLGDN